MANYSEDELYQDPDWSPEQKMWAECLYQGIKDAIRPTYKMTEYDHQSAIRWMNSDCLLPGSYLWLLEILGLEFYKEAFKGADRLFGRGNSLSRTVYNNQKINACTTVSNDSK